MTNLKKTGRRTSTPMADVISCIDRRVSTHEYEKARATACKLMGIPDLISMSESNREQRQLKRLQYVIRKVSEFIENSDKHRQQGLIAYVFEEELDKTNRLVEGFNQYMEHNQLRFGFKQRIKLLHIDKDELVKLGVAMFRRVGAPSSHNDTKVSVVSKDSPVMRESFESLYNDTRVST